MIPRIRLAHLPTPIEPLPRLSAAMRGPKLWVKRDDLTSLGMGGNKIRKLEYLLAEAQANGAKTIITIGTAQSNHCRQTAAMAARFGLRCILVLSGDAEQAPSGNYLLDRLFGAQIIWATRRERQSVFDTAFQQAWTDGLRPYAIPVGGGVGTRFGVLAGILAMMGATVVFVGVTIVICALLQQVAWGALVRRLDARMEALGWNEPGTRVVDDDGPGGDGGGEVDGDHGAARA